MIHNVFLETDRMLLRRLTEDDEDNLFALDSDPEVMRFLAGGVSHTREFTAEVTLPRFLVYYDR
ncbi:GNAT family N-acetyltransferase [Candidatus Bipolaricaulota bacterium]